MSTNIHTPLIDLSPPTGPEYVANHIGTAKGNDYFPALRATTTTAVFAAYAKLQERERAAGRERHLVHRVGSTSGRYELDPRMIELLFEQERRSEFEATGGWSENASDPPSASDTAGLGTLAAAATAPSGTT